MKLTGSPFVICDHFLRKKICHVAALLLINILTQVFISDAELVHGGVGLHPVSLVKTFSVLLSPGWIFSEYSRDVHVRLTGDSKLSVTMHI